MRERRPACGRLYLKLGHGRAKQIGRSTTRWASLQDHNASADEPARAVCVAGLSAHDSMECDEVTKEAN